MIDFIFVDKIHSNSQPVTFCGLFSSKPSFGVCSFIYSVCKTPACCFHRNYPWDVSHSAACNSSESVTRGLLSVHVTGFNFYDTIAAQFPPKQGVWFFYVSPENVQRKRRNIGDKQGRFQFV